MKYLELVKTGKAQLAMLQECLEHNIKVISANDARLLVKDMCLPVEISWEMCSCHGGRIWLSQVNTRIHLELSSYEYDKSHGIVDPDTELAWRIENELVKEIKEFSKYVYVVKTIGEYRDNEVRTNYFKSSDDASEFIFKKPGYDINSTYDEVKITFPNTNIYETRKFKEVSGNSVVVDCKRFERMDSSCEFEEKKSWTIEFHVFRKC